VTLAGCTVQGLVGEAVDVGVVEDVVSKGDLRMFVFKTQNPHTMGMLLCDHPWTWDFITWSARLCAEPEPHPSPARPCWLQTPRHAFIFN